MKIFTFYAVGERDKLTNSILLIRPCSDSQYLLWRFLSISLENNEGKGGWGRPNE